MELLANYLDYFYVISIPIILFLMLRTERNSSHRLDVISEKLEESNRLLNDLKNKG